MPGFVSNYVWNLLALAKERFGFRTILNTKGIGLRQRPDVLKHLDVLALSVDSLDAAELGTIMGAGAADGRGVLDALAFALDCRQAGGPKVVLSSVAMPDSVAAVRQVLEFAAGHGLGFHFSPELCGTTVNPELRRSQAYRDLVESVREHKRRGAAVVRRRVPDFLSHGLVHGPAKSPGHRAGTVLTTYDNPRLGMPCLYFVKYCIFSREKT